MGWNLKTLEDIGKAVDRLEDVDNRSDLLSALRDFTQERGFQHVGIGQLLNPASLNVPIADMGIADFPDEMLARWFASNHIMLDPITRYAVSARNAFTWQSAYNLADKAGRLVLDTARDYGLSSGLAVPIAIPGMPTGLVTLAHPDPKLPEAEIAALEIVCVHAYTKLLDLVDMRPVAKTYELTARETEIMHYVAAGKTNWEIGEIIGVSLDTVKVHIRNVAKKVDASNRAHAVMKTLRAGDIMP
jgi:DNA-binding CsgD family transcriptional regulator